MSFYKSRQPGGLICTSSRFTSNNTPRSKQNGVIPPVFAFGSVSTPEYDGSCRIVALKFNPLEAGVSYMINYESPLKTEAPVVLVIKQDCNVRAMAKPSINSVSQDLRQFLF